MTHDHRVLSSTWRSLLLVPVPAYLCAMAVACSDASKSSGDGDGTGGAGASDPGVTGGADASSGGASSGGATGSGGIGTGGAVTGGQLLGGTSTGGAATGGSATGGVPAGGTPTGGVTTGGVATGGEPGGQPTGGASSGGEATGGAESMGGASSGGEATGGAESTGGSSSAETSPGCGKTSTITFGQVPGESGNNVGVGDGGYVTIGDRGFAMRLPDNYDNNTPYPLIFGFHWNGGNSKEVDTGGTNGYISAHFGLQKLSNNGAIFVAPDGIGGGWQNSGGRDLQFVDDMVQLIEDNYCVDTTRLFTNGFSYGGGMSYAIACARANVFRAAAIYEGAQLSGCDGGNDPIALWQMVGLEDTVCGMNLATPIRDRFVQNNGCTPQDPPEPPRAPPYLNPGGHVCTDYEGCSAGHPLRWCVHQSGHGNAIVDGTGDLYNSCAESAGGCSDSCPCTWVPEDVWSFFTSL